MLSAKPKSCSPKNKPLANANALCYEPGTLDSNEGKMMFRFSPYLLLLLLNPLCLAQQANETPDTENRGRSLNLMQQKVSALETTGQGTKIAFGTTPILRYNDVPRRITDASVWKLGPEGRPRAILVLEIYSGRSLQYELTAGADPPERVNANAWDWSPKPSNYQWVTIPVDAIAGDERLQKRQLKQLVRGFTASEEYRGQRYALRLMPTPLDEYTDPEQGVVAGAVFAWAHGTNVELLMFVEFRRSKAKKLSCAAGFSRLGSASLDVKFQEQAFWNAPSAMRPTRSDPYYFQMETLSTDERAMIAE